MTPTPTDRPSFFDRPTSAEAALAALPDPLADWFRHRFGEPTGVQRLAWPALAAGHNLLLSAPTGTGKTLAAFLPIVADLLRPGPSDGWSDLPLRCLYVSPLKALVNDVERNLSRHLGELADFLPRGSVVPRLGVRTGDTPQEERRRLHDEPPDVLLTTPESLAILLSQPGCPLLLGNLRWVVIDELHALAGRKRGADLAVSLERLAALTAPREPRRVGLSATATPLALAANYLVGPGRPCAIARAPEENAPQLTLVPLEQGPRFLGSAVRRLAAELESHRATLIFANTRRLAERLGWALRRYLPRLDEEIAVHHSAIAPGRRREVEGRFKQGRLRAVVSSTSLELGIDIGPVDLTVLAHPPGDVIRLLQRVGRSGHGPRGLRRGLLLTSSPAELLEAAVTTSSGRAFQCEPLEMPSCPLDVLCQQLLGMAAARSWHPDGAYDLVRRAAPFADLTRGDFDSCVAYLRGLGRDGQPWLPARLSEDGDCYRVSDARTARLLRRNLGTILSEETVAVLLPGEPSTDIEDPDTLDPPPLHVGEVDEAFADRLEPGDRFLLDGRCLEFRAREPEGLRVEEVAGRPRVPRWGGDGWPLSPELARRLYCLRVQAAEALRDGPDALAGLLACDYGVEGSANRELVDYFERQESASEIPDAATLLIEAVGCQGLGATEYFLHTPLNRRGNDALARVAVLRLVRDLGRGAASAVADLGFCLRLRGELPEPPEVVRRLLHPEGFDADLDSALAESPALRERFQRVALTGLMLLRNPEGRRRKVGGRGWGGRELFEQVRGHDPDFVLLRQAMREVRTELCDASAGLAFARDLPRLSVRCRRLPRRSPFVEAWTQLGAGPTEAAESPAEALRRLHASLMGASDARPG